MICSKCQADVRQTMGCSACRTHVCRDCKVAPNTSTTTFELGFGAYCSVDCRDGQEVRTALAQKPCPVCNGTPPPRRKWAKSWEPSCVRCRDTGIIFPAAEEDTPEKRVRERFKSEHPCPVCRGQWQANTSTCLECTGTGIDPEYHAAIEAAVASTPTDIPTDEF